VGDETWLAMIDDIDGGDDKLSLEEFKKAMVGTETVREKEPIAA
jgi:hypothetical protein